MVFLLLVLAMWIHLFLNLTARQECQYWTILQHPKLQSMTNIFYFEYQCLKFQTNLIYRASNIAVSRRRRYSLASG